MKIESGKLLKIGLAASFALSLVTGNAISILAAPKVETNKVESDIYPKPQKVVYASDEGMTLNGEVNVVIHGQQEEATLPKLKEILKENNIDYCIGEELDEQKANILISSSKDHCDVCSNDDEALTKVEGYVLKTSDDTNKNGEIAIIGSDKDGAYYGVETLGQVLSQKVEQKFAELTVSDYPEIEFRGFIEGFYGIPWTHQERMSLMKDTSKYKMNTYIYAPKDDPYHRANWKDLYPEAEAKQISELAQAGKENNFNFCWTIHPGATLTFSEADYQALILKYEQLYNLGVRQFGVLFDDTDDWYNGRKQAEFINRIDTEFVKAKKDVSPMIVISARYNSAWGPGISNYFKPFMETLHSDIQVMWTGHATMSNVSRDVFEWPKRQTGVDKDVAVWWNYPVNDYCDAKLLMGAMPNLGTDLDNVSGFFSNPMNQAEASKATLFSIADYTWNTDAYQYQASWERSIKELVPEATEEFIRFASNISYLKDDGGASGPFVFSESDYLEDKITALIEAMDNNGDMVTPAKELLVEFEVILADCEKLSKLNNEGLQNEIAPFLGAYEELAKAGINSLETLIAINDGDLNIALNNCLQAQQHIKAMDNFTVHRVESSGEVDYIVDVGTKLIKPAVKAAIEKGNGLIENTLFTDIPAELFTSINVTELPKVILNSGNYEVSNVNMTLNKGDYVGIVLPKAMQIASTKVSGSELADLTIEYSINGLDWNKIDSEYMNNILTASNGPATYVRLVNETDKAQYVSIEKFQITPIYKASPSATTNLKTYENYRIENILDGDLETKFWSDGSPTSSSYIQIDLGNMISLHDLKIYFGSGDYLSNGKVMISKDGSNWSDLGNLQYVNEAGKKVASFNANGDMIKYIKIQSTANSSVWLQVFEVEFNKTVGDLGDDVVNIAEGNTDGILSNLYDRDLTTAFEPTTIADGSYFTYQMTRINSVGDLTFIQDANNICNGKVSVKYSDGSWHEIGILNEQLSTLSVNQIISEVKVEFDSSQPLPKIYEIIVDEGDIIVVESDKTALKIAIEEAEKITNEQLDKVVPVVVTEFKAALAQAKEIISNEQATQDAINNSFDRLAKVMQMLEFYKGDKTQLTSLVDKIESLNEVDYITSTWINLQPILNEAKDILDDVNVLEKEVNETYDQLIRAFLQLRLKPNKDLLNELIQNAEGLNRSNYTLASWGDFEEALMQARAVFDNEQATQKEVSKAENTLKTAIENLKTIDSVSNVTNNQNTPEISNKDQTNLLKSGNVKTGDNTSFIGIAGLGISMVVITFLSKKKRV